MVYWVPRPHILITEVRGFMSRDMALRIIAFTEPLYGRVDKLHSFHNWFAMDNYDSSCRIELTTWTLRHLADAVVHIGTGSKMVAMGVSVANLALGNLITVHSDIDALEAALAATPARVHST